MARAEIPLVVLDLEGDVVSGASVEVRDRTDNSLVTLYQSETGGTTVANPTVTDPAGRVTAWLESGGYAATISATGITTYVENFDLFVAADASTLADGAVTTAKLADGAVTYVKIDPSSIGSGASKVAAGNHQHPFVRTFPYVIKGAIAAGTYPAFPIRLATGQAAFLDSIEHIAGSGAATIDIQRSTGGGAYANISGFTSIGITTTATHTDPANQSLSSGDWLRFNVAASPTASDVTIGFHVVYTLTG